MNLFSPTILVGCVGKSCAAHDSGGEWERRLASTTRGSYRVSSLGRSGGCFGWRISGHHSGEVLGARDQQWCVEPESSLCCGRGVGGSEECSLLVLKSWDSTFNSEQKDAAIMCVFRP